MNEILHLSSAFQLSTFQWMLAVLATTIVGFSKSGIKGIAMVIVALLALVFGAKASTGILLPLLVVGDIMAVIYYHRHTQWKYLVKFLPWMMAGVILGTWFGSDLPEDLFKKGMAVIILFSVLFMVWWERSNKSVPQSHWFAGVVGLAAGFTTMVGNLAGAFSNIFFLAMRLPKDQFIGTAAWLFLIINLFKIPFHVFIWKTVTIDTLAIDLRLVPAVFLGFAIGLSVVKLIKDNRYRQLILLLTAIGAVLIFLK